MSNQYLFEPSTKGKVCLETSVGPIDIELWSKEAPKACRNFIQLCMEGYYDKCQFHTIIKDIIVQTGDPTNTGESGSSIYDQDFKVEPHQRLRFNRRGLVAMAASPDGLCGSQFFITFGPAPELDKKHTLLGKITGNTIFNFMTLNESEVDSDNRPVRPEKITSTRILSNPFDDIVPRRIVHEKRHKEKKEKHEGGSAKTRKNTGSPQTMKRGLLSFGDEMEEDAEMKTSGKKFELKSAHDILDDEKLSKVSAVQPEELGRNKDAKVDDDSEEISRIKKRLNKRKRKADSEDPKEQDIAIDDFGDVFEEQQKAEKRAELERLATESKALQKEYLRSVRGPKQSTSSNDDSKMSDPMKAYKKLKLNFKSKTEGVVKREDPQREEQTMSLLNRFQTTLKRSSVQGVLSNKKVDVSDLKTVRELLKETAVPKPRKIPVDMLPRNEDDEEIIIETIPEEIKPEWDDEAVDETDEKWMGHILIAGNNEKPAK